MSDKGIKNVYTCMWNGDHDGLTYGVIRKTMYAETKTEAAALFIDDIYKTYGVGMGAIMLHEIIFVETTGVAADWVETSEDKPNEATCNCDACTQAKANREPIKDEEIAAAYEKLAEAWQSAFSQWRSAFDESNPEDEEAEPEGHYLSISLARPGRPLLNFRVMLEDGGDEDELIGMGIHHLQSVLEFDRKKAMDRGRAAAIASNFYGLNIGVINKP